MNLHPLALLVKVSLHNNCKQIQNVPRILTWTSPCPCAELRFFSVSILWKTELCFNLSVLYTLFMRQVSAKERKLLSHLTLDLLHVYIGVVTRTTSSGGGGGEVLPIISADPKWVIDLSILDWNWVWCCPNLQNKIERKGRTKLFLW